MAFLKGSLGKYSLGLSTVCFANILAVASIGQPSPYQYASALSCAVAISFLIFNYLLSEILMMKFETKVVYSSIGHWLIIVSMVIGILAAYFSLVLLLFAIHELIGKVFMILSISLYFVLGILGTLIAKLPARFKKWVS